MPDDISVPSDVCLDCRESKFDWIQVGGVWWEELIAHTTIVELVILLRDGLVYSPFFDYLQNARIFVNATIIHNDH